MGMKEGEVSQAQIRTTAFVNNRVLGDPSTKFTSSNVLTANGAKTTRRDTDKVTAFTKRMKCISHTNKRGSAYLFTLDRENVVRSLTDEANFKKGKKEPLYCTGCPVQDCGVKLEVMHRRRQRQKKQIK